MGKAARACLRQWTEGEHKKPRVVRKTAGKHEEVDLETYKEFSKPTAMNEAIMAKVLAVCQCEIMRGPSKRCLTGTASAVARLAVEQSKVW